MIVTAALVWWDERPEDLEACVRGMANIADRVLAVDGAYRRYPQATVLSPPEQAETIRRVAAEIGLECDIYEPSELWAGQVEKRSFTLRRAAKDSDWIAVVDADWVIRTKRRFARAALEAVKPDVDVVSVKMFTPRSGMPFATSWHRKQAGRRFVIPHLFRSLPGIMVEKRHWWYSALKDGQRVWLWHPSKSSTYPVQKPYPLGARYEIEHRTLLRDERHILDSRAFLNDRELVVAETGQEDDLPGLFAPTFDFETERVY